MREQEYTLPGPEYTPPAEVPQTLEQSAPPTGTGQETRETLTSGDTLSDDGVLQEDSGGKAHGEPRRAKWTRTLLLQAAAVAAATVLATNSFGMDFLKMDGLFNDSVLTGGSWGMDDPDRDGVFRSLPIGGSTGMPSIPASERVVEVFEDGSHYGPMIYIFHDRGDSMRQMIYMDPELEPYHPYFSGNGEQGGWYGGDGIYYDSETHTLVLHHFHDPEACLQVFMMGSDFNICVTGENEIGGIISNGQMTNGTLHISGEGSLIVNREAVREEAILIQALGTGSALIVDDTVSLYLNASRSAIEIRETALERGIYRLSTSVLPDYAEGIVEAYDGLRDCYVCDPVTRAPVKTLVISPYEDRWDPGKPAEGHSYVGYMPVGGMTDEPYLEYADPVVEIRGDGTFYGPAVMLSRDDPTHRLYQRDIRYLYADPRIESFLEMTEEAGISYDPDEGVLHLEGVNRPDLTLHLFMMGSGLRIEVTGDNVLGAICSDGRVTGGTVFLTGSGSLTLNPDRYYRNAIYMDAAGTDSKVVVSPGVGLDLYAPDSVVEIADTRGWGAFCYLSEAEVPAYVQRVEEGIDGLTDCSVCDSATRAKSKRLALVPAQAGPPDEDFERYPFGGETAEPEVEYTEPHDGVGEDGTQYSPDISLGVYDPEKDNWSFHLPPVYAGSVAQTVREGIRYDAAANTLWLEDFDGGDCLLQILNMGSTFRICVTGDNALGGILATGNTSVRITGDGQLTVNQALHAHFALHLDPRGADSVLVIEDRVNLHLYGRDAAIQVYQARARKSIYYMSEKAVPGLYVSADPEDTGYSGTLHSETNGNVIKELSLTGHLPGPEETLPGFPVGGDAAFPEPSDPPAEGKDYVFYVYCRFYEEDGSMDRGYAVRTDGAEAGMTLSAEDLAERGISYDAESHTLTLENYEGYAITVSKPGDGFKIRLIGSSRLTAGMVIWGRDIHTSGCVTFTGAGSLEIQGDWTHRESDTFYGSNGEILWQPEVSGAGLMFLAEGAKAYAAIDPEVSLQIHGKDSAIAGIGIASDQEKFIYLRSEAPVPDIRQRVVQDGGQGASWVLTGSDGKTPVPWFVWEGQGRPIR